MCTVKVSLFGILPPAAPFAAYKTRNATGYHRHHFEFNSVEEAKQCCICWQESPAGD